MLAIRVLFISIAHVIASSARKETCGCSCHLNLMLTIITIHCHCKNERMLFHLSSEYSRNIRTYVLHGYEYGYALIKYKIIHIISKIQKINRNNRFVDFSNVCIGNTR